MKKYIIALAICLSAAFALGQGNGFNASRTYVANVAAPDIGQQQASKISYHQLAWTVSGAPAGCTVALDSSADGISWTAGGIITGQTCTSNGSSSIVNAIAQFVRINVTALSGGTAPIVNVNYTGWTYNPAGGGGGSPAFGSVTSGTNTQMAAVLGNGSSLIETGIGTNSSDQSRWFIGPPQPAFTMALTGGSFNSNHQEAIRITFVSAAGETLAGQENSLPNITNGCTSGATCSVTVTAPTIPSGYTGYTVYNTDCSAAPCTGGELRVTTCVNITANCTFGSNGTGAALPTTNTAYPFPSPLGANLCSPGTNPFVFVQDVTGVYYPYMGADSSNTGSNPPAPYNKMVFCRPVWFNDTANDPPPGKNAMVLFAHVQNGVTVNQANQDRALYSTTSNCFPNIQTCADSSAHYALEGIQVEQDIVGTPTINGSPDAEVTAGSFQLSLNTNGTNYSSNGFGTNAIRASLFRQPGAGVDTGGSSVNGIWASVSNASTLSGAGAIFSAIQTNCAASVVSVSVFCADVYIHNSQVASGWTASYGTYVANNASFTPAFHWAGVGGISDLFIQNYQRNWASDFNAPIYVNQIGMSDSGALPFQDPITVQGGILTTHAVTAVQTSGASCSGGASTYTYTLVSVDSNGGMKTGAAASTTAACTNPLTSGNPATLHQPVPFTNTGVDHYLVYRTGGPMATGKIGTWSCGNTNPGSSITGGCVGFTDTGLAADGGSVPTADTTGGVFPVGYTALAANKFFVTTNFTTANNTSLQAITGLVFNLSPTAGNYQFSCHGAYSQATAAVAVAFGIQAATIGATNIFATGKQQIAAATAPAPQTLATLATTTATNITTGTPGVTATNYTFDLDGTIEEPANDAGNVINIMVSTATGADAVTVLRGSYCYLY